MAGKQVARWAGRVCTMVVAVAAVTACLPRSAPGEMIGNQLWNLRENHEDFFHDNDSWIRPWETGYDNGYGMFQAGHTLEIAWGPTGTVGNSLDGSLSLIRGVDTQFHVWTYLYTSTPTIVSLTGEGDCVPRWFLNYQFDSPHGFPIAGPASIDLLAGWNRLDITGYNQNAGFLFESGALASQVAIMNTAPVPEPSTTCALASLAFTAGLLRLIRRRYGKQACGAENIVQ